MKHLTCLRTSPASASFLTTLFGIMFLLCAANTTGLGQSNYSFPLSSVKLERSVFRHAQQRDLDYILKLDVDRLLAPFLREAGLPAKASSYGNWENTGLDGHIGGHYLSALSLMYASTGDIILKERLDYMIAQLAACQAKSGNGYVGGVPGGNKMWEDIRRGKISADNFSLNGKWVPLYNIHKLFAGLYDAHVLGKSNDSRRVFLGLCDWFLNLTSGLSDAQIQEMLKSEHGGMNEIFALAAELTGDHRYLDLATKLSHKKILSPLLAGRDSLTGLHANTQIPKVIGFKKIADLSGDSSWFNAAKYFWNTVVDHRTVSIGGNSVREHFHPAKDFSLMIESNQGPETCNTYNMMKLTKSLFQTDARSTYIDFYERALYNHILSSQHPVHGGLVYFTPMRPRHYRVYSDVNESFWCCVGSGIENHAKYGELIYSHSDTDVYVNLFIPSVLEWKEKRLKITQRTDFPSIGKTTLVIQPEKASRFSIYVRKPSWVASHGFKVLVNEVPVKVEHRSNGYVSIDRKWKPDDVITVLLPMEVRAEMLPDGSSWGSFVYGPIVLAAVTDTTDVTGLVADDSRMGHVAEGKFYPVDEAPAIVKDKPDFLSEVKRVDDGELVFSVTTLVQPAKYRDLKLVPFYSIHDKRYMVYWPIVTPGEFDNLMTTFKSKEKEEAALRAQTVDEVTVGEQQPEVEHRYNGDSTEMGTTNGKTWRNATGWFSYELANAENKGAILRIMYSTGGHNRNFKIFLNNELLRDEQFENKWDDNTMTIDYVLPENLRRADRLVLKFDAQEGANTGRIHSVMLLKE